MKLEIFQAYYKQEQVAFLDKEFVPFDNTANTQGQYREYPLFLKIYDYAQEKNLDIWGYTSWRWKDKLPGLTAQNLLDSINLNPGYDVYYWNPCADHAVASLNVWEQGQFWHPSLMEIMKTIMPRLNLDPNLLYQVQHPDTIYFGLYCAGNNKFWQGFLNFAQQYYNCIDTLPNNIKLLHSSGAKYPAYPNLWYFPFIHERLLSTYLVIKYKDLKIWHYHHGKEHFGYMWDRLYFLKTMAIKYKEPDILMEWQNLRTYLKLNYNFSDTWVNRLDKNLINHYYN